MIDLKRTGGILIAVAFLGLCLLIDESALRASRRWWPVGLRNDWARSRIFFKDMVGARLAGIAEQGSPDGRPIGVFVGSSTLEAAIDPATIGPAIDPGLRWVSLVCYAATAFELDLAIETMLRGGIRPRVVVVGVELRLLARNPSYRYADMDDPVGLDTGPLRSAIREMRLRSVVSEVRELTLRCLNNGFPDRKRANAHLDAWSATARLRMLQGLGQGLPAIFRPEPDAWANRGGGFLRPGDPPPPVLDPARELILQEGDLAASGVFDAGLYGVDRPASRALVDLVRRARSAGAGVLLVILPTSDYIRSRMPAEAVRTMAELEDEMRRSGGVEVLWFHQAMPDEWFRDHTHLTRAGRDVFARLLRDRLDHPGGAGPGR